MEQVAIIGAGPGGIAVARELKRRGFAPTIFEMHDSAGRAMEQRQQKQRRLAEDAHQHLPGSNAIF